MEADTTDGLGGKGRELADGFEERGDFLVVIAEAFFEFEEFEGELVLRAEKFAELHERANDLNAGVNGNGAVQDAGEHDGAVLGEDVRVMASAAARVV